ncbi:MAG: flagellar basal body rod protein FlgC [Deltaproteobacteria bacterium CG_4_10_14_3_um_filter_60_8]|nr:MAG: flagellar basal body rod protein FlgC [Desulfobacterales bacterium CG2_30_60_27]PIP43073.1 MAG: flagellar basal body rod protein FlgC [Deltaproteobacteria bacterium CG23_combo_of_CG06-09_8_20_14_all_60_8]PIY20724.1 MAG: flagellar basal body rod protein FlgC [Deltaproteobacteria bacterium CG_4_10_14_3_um_filter_60_8]
MNILQAMEISGSALTAERTRLNIAAMNMANANTTRTMEGGPYKAKSVVFAAKPLARRDFESTLRSASATLRKVEVAEVVEDKAPFKEVYDPSHPDADASGVVRMPNVNEVEQMVDIMGAKRAYEANVTALDAVKSMAMKALDISR